jgi:hypothetical protein
LEVAHLNGDAETIVVAAMLPDESQNRFRQRVYRRISSPSSSGKASNSKRSAALNISRRDMVEGCSENEGFQDESDMA